MKRLIYLFTMLLTISTTAQEIRRYTSSDLQNLASTIRFEDGALSVGHCKKVVFEKACVDSVGLSLAELRNLILDRSVARTFEASVVSVIGPDFQKGRCWPSTTKLCLKSISE